MKQGINFRGSLGYVTDGADDHGEVSTIVNYPTLSAQGHNVGWVSLGGSHAGNDSDSALDPRLAGSHSCSAWTISEYGIELPATGDYNLRVAAGDAVKTISNIVNVQVFDDTTLLGTLVARTAPAVDGTFADATDAFYSPANWPGSNSIATFTFASTKLRFRIPASGDLKVISHLYVESVGGGGININGSPASITLSGQSGQVDLGTSINGTPAIINLTGLTGDVSLSTDISINGTPATINITALTGEVLLSNDIAIDGVPANIIINALAGEVSLGTDIRIDGIPATISINGVTGKLIASEAAIVLAKGSSVWLKPPPGSTIRLNSSKGSTMQ